MPGPTVPPTHLSTTARRALAAAAVRTATDLPALCAQLVADQLDGVSSAVLRGAELDDAAARAVLLMLWAA
jgi:hypothetical protein